MLQWHHLIKEKQFIYILLTVAVINSYSYLDCCNPQKCHFFSNCYSLTKTINQRTWIDLELNRKANIYIAISIRIQVIKIRKKKICARSNSIFPPKNFHYKYTLNWKLNDVHLNASNHLYVEMAKMGEIRTFLFYYLSVRCVVTASHFIPIPWSVLMRNQCC